MGDTTEISWADKTFNTHIGCTKVSPACTNCYAERDMDHRFGKVAWGPNGTRVVTSEANWQKPVRWNRDAEQLGVRYRVFCASLADVFEDWQGRMLRSRKSPLTPLEGWISAEGKWGWFSTPVDHDALSKLNLRLLRMNDVRDRLFKLINETPNLDWLLLTKRPENIRRMWPPREWHGGAVRAHDPLRENVWLGVSVENQEYADKRIPELLKCRNLSPVLFLSCEPLLGIVHLDQEGRTLSPPNALAGYFPGIDWLITGGESGPGARPSDPEWFRYLRDQCKTAGVPFHFKQFGEFDADQVRVGKKNAGRTLDGVIHDAFPSVEFVK